MLPESKDMSVLDSVDPRFSGVRGRDYFCSLTTKLAPFDDAETMRIGCIKIAAGLPDPILHGISESSHGYI